MIPLRVRRPIGITLFRVREATSRTGRHVLGSLPLLAARELVYDDEYFDAIDRSSAAAYERLVDTLLRLRSPESVVDIGCGSGFMLKRFAERGIAVRGVEGSTAAIRRSDLGDRIVRANLERGVPDVGRFDLCICIEVAEHLSARAAPRLVERLTDLSDLVVFSAAPPGQPGTSHINLQPKAYWLELFASRGFAVSELDAEVRAALEDVREPDYIRTNLMVLERTSTE